MRHERGYERKPRRLIESDHRALKCREGDEQLDRHVTADGEPGNRAVAWTSETAWLVFTTRNRSSIGRRSGDRSDQDHGKEVGDATTQPQA
jgi:hypothetical protein